MAILVKCPCGQEFLTHDENAGGHETCPGCGRDVVVHPPEPLAADVGVEPGPSDPAKADGKSIATALSGGVRSNPFRWPATETIRGAVVAGTPAGLVRIRNAESKARPELLAAMAAGGDTSIQIAIVPSTTLRRSIEESLTVLPQELGGGPITTVTQGLRWISLTLVSEPKPMIRAVVQAKVDQGVLKEAVLRDWLDAALTRADDRELLGLSGPSP